MKKINRLKKNITKRMKKINQIIFKIICNYIWNKIRIQILKNKIYINHIIDI